MRYSSLLLTIGQERSQRVQSNASPNVNQDPHQQQYQGAREKT